MLADIALAQLRLWRMHRGVTFDRADTNRELAALDGMTLEDLRNRIYRTAAAALPTGEAARGRAGRRSGRARE